MRRLLIATIAIFAAVPAAAQPTQAAGAQATTTYRSGNGYSVDLPAAWVRAPASAVEGMSRAAGAPTPGLTYEAVFQAGRGRWPAQPFATIARGAVPEWLTPTEFRRRWTADDAQAQLQGRVASADSVRGARVGLRVGQPWWDEANRAAWMRADEPAGGFAWTVLRLHPAGGSMIILQYNAAPGEDEEQVLARLDDIVRSIRVD